MTLGERIRHFAKQHSGNVDAFAKEVGVHGVQMAKYANGTSKPSLEVLQRLAMSGVSVHWLVTGSGPMRIELGDQPDPYSIPDIHTAAVVAERLADYINSIANSTGVIPEGELQLREQRYGGETDAEGIST